MFRHSDPHRHEETHLHQPDDHDHTHGALEPALLATDKGIRAIKRSMLGLLVTAFLQAVTVAFTSSVALLADTIHNFGDAATAIPLWIAFLMARKKPTKRFNYGYGRVEDVAGIVIVVIMLLSGVLAGYESLIALVQPHEIKHLGAVAAASLIGFAGNELAAIFRIRTGREIGSAALVADGYHARLDGLTSLGVLIGVIGIWLGYPQADPFVALGITVVIFKIVWDSGKALFTRLLDGVDTEVIAEVRHAANHIPEVRDVTEVRVRWVGHRLWAEVNVAVDSHMTVEQAHKIANEVRHQLLHHLRYLSHAIIHVDPVTASGESHHRIGEHAHDEFSTHFH